MKLSIIIFLINSFIFCGIFEKKDTANNQLMVIHILSNKSKADIFEKTSLWITEAFVSSKDVISYKSIEKGRIIINGYAITPKIKKARSTIKVRFRLQIDIKDGKARMIFNNISCLINGRDYSRYKYIWNASILELNSLSKTYENYVNKGDQLDDW